MKPNGARQRNRHSRPFTYLNCWNPTPNLISVNTSGNHTICANHCTGSERHARKNRTTRAEPHVVANSDAAAILGGGLILNVSISRDPVIGSNDGTKLGNQTSATDDNMGVVGCSDVVVLPYPRAFFNPNRAISVFIVTQAKNRTAFDADVGQVKFAFGPTLHQNVGINCGKWKCLSNLSYQLTSPLKLSEGLSKISIAEQAKRSKKCRKFHTAVI